MHSTFQHCVPSLFLIEEQPCGKECILFLCKMELVFLECLWCPLVELIAPNQPPYPEMELADMISVNKNEHHRHKHMKAFILNIWLNKSSWPPLWRKPSFQPWNVLEPEIFLSCVLVLFNKASVQTAQWQIPHRRSHLLLRCKAGYPKTSSYAMGNFSWLYGLTHRACYFWKFGPIYTFLEIKTHSLISALTFKIATS